MRDLWTSRACGGVLGIGLILAGLESREDRLGWVGEICLLTSNALSGDRDRGANPRIDFARMPLPFGDAAKIFAFVADVSWPIRLDLLVLKRSGLLGLLHAIS